MRHLLLALSLVLSLATAHAEVVRLAPDFTFPGIGKMQSLKGLRGQPVVLLIDKSPKTKQIKEQVKFLREIYQQFANKKVIFVSAFTQESGPIVTDIPFVIANNGPGVASAYGLQNTAPPPTPPPAKPTGWHKMIPTISMPKFPSGPETFSIAIIGRDGNLDYQTNKVLLPERVRDVIQNSYDVQATTGR